MIHIDQEPDHVPRRPLAWSAGVAIVGIIASLGATIWLVGGQIADYLQVDSTRPARIESESYRVPTEGERLRQSSERILDEYGWADRARDTVDVPIDVAIAQYLKRLEEGTR